MVLINGMNNLLDSNNVAQLSATWDKDALFSTNQIFNDTF